MISCGPSGRPPRSVGAPPGRVERPQGATAGLLALLLLAAAGVDAQVVIDDWVTAQGPLAVTVPPETVGDVASSSAAAGGGTVLGGQRDLLVSFLAGGGGGESVSAAVASGSLAFTADSGSRGSLLATWDGDSDPAVVDPTGLGGVDLTAGGTQGAFRLTVEAATAGAQLEIEVFTDADHRARTSRVLPDVASPTELLVDFSQLAPSPGATGPADPTDVGAITLRLLADGGSVEVTAFDTLPPQLAALQADFTDGGTPIGGGSVAPGEIIRYRVTITNTGGGANGVNLSDVLDPNVTMVGSARTTPIARDDQYTGFGNVTLVVDGLGAPALAANDGDPDGDPVTLVPATGQATEQGGSVDIAADGTFSYTPPAGFTGVDSFAYTIAPVAGDPTEDAVGNPVGPFTGAATVSLDRTVWFVDNSHGGPFEGTQANPFATLAAAQAASGTGDVIRVREGDGTDTGYDQGFVFQDGQRLVGGASDLEIGGQVIEPGAGRSIHSNGAGNVFELAAGNEVSGVRLNPTAGHGLAGNGSSATLADDVVIYTSAAGGGVSLAGHTGGFTFAGGMITSTVGPTNTAVVVQGGSGTFSFAGSPVSHDGGGLIDIQNTSGGAAFDFTGSSPTLTNGTLDGIVLANNAGGAVFTFDAIGDVGTGSGRGIFLANSGTVNVGTVGSVAATGGAALDVSGTTLAKAGGAGPITVAGLASVGPGGRGVSLDGVQTDLTVTGATTVTDAATDGIRVANGAGASFDFGATSVTDTAVGSAPTAEGIDLGTGNAGATFTFDSLAVVADGGDALHGSGVTVLVGGTGNSIAATGGAALAFENCTLGGLGGGTATFLALSSAASPFRGVNLVGLSGGFTATGGAVTGASNTTFHVFGGAPTIVYGGTVTQTNAARAVNVESTTGGSVSLTGKVTGGASSTGVRIHDADGNTSFADLDLGTSGSPMTSTALTLTGGSTGTQAFADTQVFTSGATGIDADGGGTVEVTGAGNRVSTANGTAVHLRGGTTIGANEITFERIDASGSTHGIRLNAAGSGFTVTGVGATDGSGGTIQNITARGIEVIDTDDLSLSNMSLTDAATTNGVDPTDPNGTCGGLALGQNLGCNAPVHLQTVAGAVLDNVDILRSAQVGINGHTVSGFALRNSVVTDAGNQANEFSLKFRDLLGVSEITDSTVRRTMSAGTEVDQVRIQNFSSTPLVLTVTNSHFDTTAVDGPTSAFENTGFVAVGHAVADMRLELVGSFFQNNKGPGLTAGVSDASSNATVDIVVTGGTFSNNNVGLEAIGHGTASTITFDINGATVDDNPAAGINVDLNSSSAAGVTLRGHVRNNAVTHTGAGDCIQVNTRGAGGAIVAITDNTLNESGFERAIDVSTQEGSGDLDVVITGNTLNMTGPNPLRAMNVNSGADTGDSGTMCAKVGGATATERNTVNSISGGDTRVRVRRRENTIVNLQGVPGPHPQTDQATIEAYITSQNTGATGEATVGGGFGDASCQVSPLP